MFNPYILLGLLLFLLSSSGVSYYYGGKHCQDRHDSLQLKAQSRAIEESNKQSEEDNEISEKVEVEKEVIRYVYVKVKEAVSENIENNPDYDECSLDDIGLQLYNKHPDTKEDSTS